MILPFLFLPMLVVGLTLASLPKNDLPCANSVTCAFNQQTKVENGAIGVFLGQRISAPTINLTEEKPAVLGTQVAAQIADGSTATTANNNTTNTAATNGRNVDNKHIYVDLDKQTLYAFDSSALFMQTLVSTGKWGRTPTGDFTIWSKLRSTRMSGGSGNDAYDLPNVPYVMFFSNNQVPKESGFSLHGAYWHNNFGHPMSHGCVNMRITDAEVLYNWARPVSTASTTYATKDDQGTPVSICNKIEMGEGQNPVCIETN